jgi:hypothetical protein
MRTDDPEALETSYLNYAKTIPTRPYPTLKGIQLMLHMLAPQMPQAKSAKPVQFVDLSFLDVVEKEDFSWKRRSCNGGSRATNLLCSTGFSAIEFVRSFRIAVL